MAKLDEVGGASYLEELTNEVLTALAYFPIRYVGETKIHLAQAHHRWVRHCCPGLPGR